MLRQFVAKHSATKNELQSLAGYLSHCSYVIRGSRVFVRRLINLINSLSSSRSRCVIDELVRADLEWWLRFSLMFNGKAKIIGGTVDNDMYFCTDASLSGFGGTYDSDFFMGTWKVPPSCLSKFVHSFHWANPPSFAQMVENINVYEMWPVLGAVVRWGSSWRKGWYCILITCK